MQDEMSAAEAIAEVEAMEPPTTAWALARGHLTKAARMQWAMTVLSMRQKGKSQYTIADELGMSQPTVSRMLELAYKTIVLPKAEEARKHEVEIVDRMIEEWLPRALSNDKDAAAVLAKYLDRRAKLTGSDAPVRVDAQVVEVTQQDLELQELLREAEAKTSALEQELQG